jgi:hypothetical protein
MRTRRRLASNFRLDLLKRRLSKVEVSFWKKLKASEALRSLAVVSPSEPSHVDFAWTRTYIQVYVGFVLRTSHIKTKNTSMYDYYVHCGK